MAAHLEFHAVRMLILAAAQVIWLFSCCEGSKAAATCDNFATPQQIEDGLDSISKETRFRAQNCGLASDDRFVRGLVIQKLLSGGRIDFTVDNAPGDTKSAQIVSTMEPLFAIEVKWTEDSKHFQGRTNRNQSISGSLIGDKINVVVSYLVAGNLNSPCQARLILNEDHNSMVGPLVCANIPGKFTLQIDL